MNPTEIPSLPESAPLASKLQPSDPVEQLTDDDLDILVAAIPESAKRRQADCIALWRELPRLLAEGEAGRFALIHGGSVISLWDSLNDAAQAGYEKFGVDGLFMTPSINALELVRIRQFLGQQRAKQCQR